MAGKELEDSDDEDEDSESSESSNDDDEDDGDELGALYAQAGVMQPARVQAETMQHEEPIKSQDGLFASAANFDSKVNKQQPAHKGIQDKTNRGQLEPGNKYILEETDKSERFSGLDNFHRMQIADRFEAHPPVLDFASKAEDSSKPAWLADLKMEVSRQRAELVEIQKVENKTRALGAKKKRFQYVGSSDDDDDNDDNANPVVLERASLLELQNFHIKSHICLRDSISDLEDDLAAQLAAQVQIEELAKRGQEQAMKKMVMDETSESESDEDISRFHARAAESKNDKDMTLIFTRTPQSSNNFGRDSILSVDGDLIQEHNQALAEIQEAARLSQEQAKAKKIQVSAEEPNDQRSDVMHSFKKAEAKKKRQQLKALKFTKDDISRRWAIESLRSINEDSIENQGDVLEAIQEKARSAQSQALNMIIETDDEEEDEEDLYQVQRKAIALKRASELRQLNLERADEKLELSDDSSIGSLEDVVARHELIHAEIQSNWNHTHE